MLENESIEALTSHLVPSLWRFNNRDGNESIKGRSKYTFSFYFQFFIIFFLVFLCNFFEKLLPIFAISHQFVAVWCIWFTISCSLQVCASLLCSLFSEPLGFTYLRRSNPLTSFPPPVSPEKMASHEANLSWAATFAGSVNEMQPPVPLSSSTEVLDLPFLEMRSPWGGF